MALLINPGRIGTHLHGLGASLGNAGRCSFAILTQTTSEPAANPGAFDGGRLVRAIIGELRNPGRTPRLGGGGPAHDACAQHRALQAFGARSGCVPIEVFRRARLTPRHKLLRAAWSVPKGLGSKWPPLPGSPPASQSCYLLTDQLSGHCSRPEPAHTRHGSLRRVAPSLRCFGANINRTQSIGLASKLCQVWRAELKLSATSRAPTRRQNSPPRPGSARHPRHGCVKIF